MKPIQARSFTLIELLIVIVLLGLLAAIMLPRFRVTKTKAVDTIVESEMQDIRRAFQRFYNDVMPTETDDGLGLFRRYGLAPLITSKLTNDDGSTTYFEVSAWDEDKQRGWRGPYLTSEGLRTVPVAAADAHDGQEPNSGGTVKLPVICDPYCTSPDRSTDAHFYRILCPGSAATSWDYDNMGLVFVGPSDPDQLDTDERTSALVGQSTWADTYFNRSSDTMEIVKRLVIDRE